MAAETDASFGRSVASIGVFVGLAAFVVVGWQFFAWFNYGHWFPFTLRNAMASIGIGEPSFNSLRVREIWGVIAEGALSFYLFMIGGSVALAGIRLTEKARGKVREEKSKRRWGAR